MEQQAASSAANTGITRYVAGLHILSKLLRLCNPGTKVLLAWCFLMHILCKCKSCKCIFVSKLLNPDALFQCQGFFITVCASGERRRSQSKRSRSQWNPADIFPNWKHPHSRISAEIILNIWKKDANNCFFHIYAIRKVPGCQHTTAINYELFHIS